MKRLSRNNLWKETDFNDVQDITYDSPFPRGNAIVIAIKDNL
jgi:hypothetical protein